MTGELYSNNNSYDANNNYNSNDNSNDYSNDNNDDHNNYMFDLRCWDQNLPHI